MKGDALEDWTSSETRLPSPSVARAALVPIPHSVSDNALEMETPPRQRVSFDLLRIYHRYPKTRGATQAGNNAF
jgi:hypothetical protein